MQSDSLATYVVLATIPVMLLAAVTWRLTWPRWKLVAKLLVHPLVYAVLAYFLGIWSVVIAWGHQGLGLGGHIWFSRKHGFTWYAVEDPERYVRLSKEMVGFPASGSSGASGSGGDSEPDRGPGVGSPPPGTTLPIVPFLLILMAACGFDGSHPAVTVQDSAGIRIVVSHRPAWNDGDQWRLRQQPLLQLGTLDGDPAQTFHRLSGVHMLGEDRMAVLDEGAGQVRFFSTDGTPQGTFGGQGEGPGEFQALGFAGFHADSLWLFDARQLRTTVLHPASGVYRVARAAVDNPALGPVGVLPGGRMVLTADLAFVSPLTDPPSEGLHRFRAAYLRLDALGALEDTLFLAAGSERVVRYGAQTMEMLRPLLPRGVSHAIRGTEVLQGSQERYEIGVHSDDGTLLSLIRRSDIDLLLDESAYAAAIEERVMAAPEPARPGLRALYGDQPRPEHRPAYARFLVDATGFLWVQDVAYSGEARSWAVFDPEGVWLGEVEFPEGFRPTQIEEGRVAGIWRDGLGVEYARIYELHREPGSPE